MELEIQGDMGEHYEAIRQDLMQTGLIENVALADDATIYGGNNTDGISWQGKSPGKVLFLEKREPRIFSTSGMKILEGRNFEPTDSINYDNPSVRGTRLLQIPWQNLWGRVVRWKKCYLTNMIPRYTLL